MRSREISMLHYIGSTFRDSLGLCFLTSKKEDNAVKLRQYLEIFYNRFVQAWSQETDSLKTWAVLIEIFMLS